MVKEGPNLRVAPRNCRLLGPDGAWGSPRPYPHFTNEGQGCDTVNPRSNSVILNMIRTKCNVVIERTILGFTSQLCYILAMLTWESFLPLMYMQIIAGHIYRAVQIIEGNAGKSMYVWCLVWGKDSTFIYFNMHMCIYLGIIFISNIVLNNML